MLATSIGSSLHLDCCVYNASGPRSGTVEALSKVGASRAGAITSKSCTLVKQDGNELPRAIASLDLGKDICEGSFNSEGLPNNGIDYYIDSHNLELLGAFEKPYIVSLSGHTLEDNCDMLRRTLEAGVRNIELNLACPNIAGEPMVAYNFVAMDAACKALAGVITEFGNQRGGKTAAAESKASSGDRTGANGVTFGVKLAPYFDKSHCREAVRTILKYYPTITFITTCNSMGNALFVDTDAECPSILGNGGFGGLGGGYIKHTALANIAMIYQLLTEAGKQEQVHIVGVGGIATGDDAFQAILCGASAVQVGTCHWTEGATCFDRIAGELEIIMTRKGYSSIQQFRGNLKPYQAHKQRPGLTKNKRAAAAAASIIAPAAATPPVPEHPLGRLMAYLNRIDDDPGPLYFGLVHWDTIIAVLVLVLGFMGAMYFDVLPRFVPPPTYSMY